MAHTKAPVIPPEATTSPATAPASARPTEAATAPAPTDPITRDPRWAALVARDAAWDGKVYYAVTTTGVYCRPSCSARNPLPQNVRFFDTGQAAERAGFRPCKRCRPEDPAGDRRAALVAAACRTIEQALTPPRLAELAAQHGVSPSHLHRLFKETLGLTPKAYAEALQDENARAALAGGARVTDAVYAAGFNSTGRFYARAAAIFGMTPSAYRAGGADEPIRFAVGECSLGAILVAQSERGICAITLGDDPERLVRELQDRFPRAKLIGGDPDFEQVVARVVGFVEAPAGEFDLPLDVRGTAFQRRVWEALRSIPAGATVSYSEIARRIGAPQAARAVAGACAANRLAVAIPCHRVVRNDGDLSGYRWGVARKRALLEKEAPV
ncbi:MAG TPA: bifunctional DNA-binding transcriptional regulator/O6-methylguanine-DNA methyltransferase Ada [Limnochordia bacterium]|nr:bifunctional DNA-binding transcriptional regulator/O6-methylguanine-DNA methyltransferase Ada [Limnochordia bacterium]